MIPPPPTYPARPVNGGPLHLARPKSVGLGGSPWYYEPKFNGWRALVHVPTGAMFNRKLERLTIEREFAPSLAVLHNSPFVWLDCEALERRHGLGRGSLIVLDAVATETGYNLHQQDYRRRHDLLGKYFLGLGLEFLEPETITPGRAFLCPHIEDAGTGSPGGELVLQLWNELKMANARLNCPFYEGVVAKRADSLYPIQLRSPEIEFPFWVKHRWAF